MKFPRPDFSPELSLACDAAFAAGERVMSVYQSQFSHTLKEGREPLTEADIASDEIIRKVLAPTGLTALSEESRDTGERLTAERMWIVDPLDGTADFIEKTGEFSVMIALVKNHEPVVGVVYAPATRFLYVAEKGKGAYCFSAGEWRRLRVSDVSATAAAKAVVSKHHFFQKDRVALDALGVREFVQKGSAGLKIADVAEGTADCYFTTTNKIKQWDTAAAHCILIEAGGRMTDMAGTVLAYNIKDVYHQNGILASNGLLHDAIVKQYNI